MSMIKITSGKLSLAIELNDTPTARKLLEKLPFDGTINTWGDEIYFETPVTANPEKEARAVVEVGDVGYWPPGQALCVFFGPTPASEGNEPRAASPVTVIGRVQGDARRAGQFRDGEDVRVSKETG